MKRPVKAKTKRAETPEEWSSKQSWEELREDFFYSVDARGEYTHRTIIQFAIKKYPTDPKRRRWLIQSINNAPHPKIKHQGDWTAERLIDKSKFSRDIVKLSEKVSSELDILEAGKILADSYTPFQQRIFDLWKELEGHFGQVIFKNQGKDPKTKANLLQDFKQYTSALNSIIDLKIKVDNQFLKSLGWDRPQFLMYFANLKRNSENTKEPEAEVFEDKVKGMMLDLVKNQIEKSRMYDLALPDEIEVVAKEVEE